MAEAAGRGNAGIASNSVELAHVKVKPGGTVALVLPASCISGQSWGNLRGLLKRAYRNLSVVSVATDGSSDRAFSADTGMAEVLLLTTRCSEGQEGGSETLFANLHSRPASLAEATETARQIGVLSEDVRAGKLLVVDSDVVGSFGRAPLDECGCAGLREERLARSMMTFRQGILRLPRRRETAVPVTTLEHLGKRGRLHRDISGSEKSPTSGLPRGPFEAMPFGGTPLAAVG